MKGFLFNLITLVLIFELYLVDSQCLQSFNNDMDSVFPDVIIDYELDSSTTISLKAFTNKNIKQIQASEQNTGNKYNGLNWISLGYPKLLETKETDNDLSQIFHFNDDGFFTFVETLNKDYKNALAQGLIDKYLINVSSAQIVNIPLAYFRCELKFYDEKNLRNVTINGQVEDLNQHPYKLIFNAPLNSNDRNLFVENFKIKKNIQRISCEVESEYNEEKKIAFKITPKEIEELNLSDKIFGQNELVYLTRYQIDSLSDEIYSSFHILEENQITENDFKKKFHDLFLKKIQFSNEKFDQVLKSLSKYLFNFEKNKSPNKIKSKFGQLFNVNKNGNNSFISVNGEFVDDLSEKSKNNQPRISYENGVGGLCVESSVQIVTDKQAKWSKNTKKLIEQISELNSENNDGIEWEFKEMQILPKSLKVAKITKSSFLSITFHFPNLKIVKLMPQFQCSFTINSNGMNFYQLTNKIKLKNQKIEESISKLLEQILILNKTSSALNQMLTKFLNETIDRKFDLIQNLTGHTGWINCLISLDDEHFASGSNDRTIKIWNAYSFSNLKTLEHSDRVYSLVKISDERFATGLEDGSINIWNYKTSNLIKNFKAHNSSVYSLVMLKDGNLVSCSEDKSIKIWNLVSTQLVKTITNAHSHPSNFYVDVKMIVLDDGSFAVTSNNEIKIWNDSSSEIKRTLTSDGTIISLLLLKNNMIASGSNNKKIELWNINNGKLFRTIETSSAPFCLEMLPSGNLIAGLKDGSFEIFNPQTGFLIKTVKHHSNRIKSFLILRNNYLISASSQIMKVF